jgi:hypothetical protein
MVKPSKYLERFLVEIVYLDMTLDRLVYEEENAMCEPRTGYGNRKTRIIGAKVANPGIFWELWPCGAVQTFLLISRFGSVEWHHLCSVSVVLAQKKIGLTMAEDIAPQTPPATKTVAP